MRSPGGALRPRSPLTAATAAAWLLRVRRFWQAETVPGGSVVVAGRPAAVLMVRVRYRLYAADAALYGRLPAARTRYVAGALSVDAANACGTLEELRLISRVEHRPCTAWGAAGGPRRPAALPAPPLLV